MITHRSIRDIQLHRNHCFSVYADALLRASDSFELSIASTMTLPDFMSLSTLAVGVKP